MSGETLHYRWQMSPEEFMATFSFKTNTYSKTLSEKLSVSIKNLLESGIRTVCNKHKIKDTGASVITQYLYYETLSRHHFGKETLCSYFMNDFRISLAMDPEVRTWRLNTLEFHDTNLLTALLLTRYAPDLLNFPFEKKRSIVPETIAYAQKLNEHFPRRTTTDDVRRGRFHLQPRDMRAEKILASGRNNPNIPGGLLEKCLKATFESSRTHGLFTAYFDEELYRYAATYYDTHDFGHDRLMYAVTGVAKVLEDIEISQRNHPPYQDMQRFLEQDFYFIHDDAEHLRAKHEI